MLCVSLPLSCLLGKVRLPEALAPPALPLALPELSGETAVGLPLGPLQSSLAIMGILASVQGLAVYKQVLHLKWPP